MPNLNPNWKGYDDTVIAFLTSQKKGTQATYKSLFKLIMAYPNWNDEKPNTTMTPTEMLTHKRQDKTYSWERKTITFKQWVKTQETRNGDHYGDHAADCAINTLRSFFEYYREPLKLSQSESRKLNRRSRRKTQDYMLDNEDIAKMAYVANLNEKYVLLAGKSFGLRVGDFITITYGMYRSINLDQPAPVFLGELSTEKEGVLAFPFIDSDALPVVKKLLSINEDKANWVRVVDVQEEEMTSLLQRLAVRAGINLGGKRLRFHCLRKYLVDRLANNMSESKWKQIVGKAVSEDAYVSAFELRSSYEKTMQWTTIFAGDAGLAGFSVEDVAELKELLSHKGEYKRLFEMLARGDLVHRKDSGQT